MLNPNEIVTLAPDVMRLIADIRRATDANSDGGTQITRAERKVILQAAGKLALVLLRDSLT